ncbi:ankyrin repeat [Cedratvirus lausannensis]|uniref:Ankyrin repeat n=1 Tax=Cedratvirus lausannensis TaxID=2023205 RepID=A0A285PXT2_9VIRU|nr:ankyrin repeat [Cedratvirus lausannensis]
MKEGQGCNSHGHLFGLDSLCRNGQQPQDLEFSMQLLEEAIKLGCVNVLECSGEVPYNTCTLAAAHGQLKVLKWGLGKGKRKDREICNQAALNGHLEILKWAIANGWFRFTKFYVKRSFT